jgi:CheY-like chemotaxis protein
MTTAPLNGIIGLTSLIQAGKGNLTPEQSEAVDMIDRSGDLLLQVVNDVLDYAKLETGNVEISKEDTLIYPLIRQAVDAIRTKAQERNIKIRTSVAKNLPSHIYTDGRRIQQILFNLLGNAVKFSSDGGIIEFKAVKRTNVSGTSCLRITVKDYGKGIDKSHFAKIFQPFQQADSGTEQTHGGTGLGLTITSSLVKALGGSIAVDSEVGKWSEFTVELELGELRSMIDDGEICQNDVCRLPTVSSTASLGESSVFSMSSTPGDTAELCEVQHFTTSSNNVGVDSNVLGNFRVLVAEDNHINQMLVDRALRRLGVRSIEIVGNGACAVERCNQAAFDLILMDQEMPVMNGMDATRLIRTRCCNSNALTKIIFVTAHATNGYEAKTLDAGADGFLPKPYKFTDLKNIIEACFEQNHF